MLSHLAIPKNLVDSQNKLILENTLTYFDNFSNAVLENYNSIKSTLGSKSLKGTLLKHVNFICSLINQNPEEALELFKRILPIFLILILPSNDQEIRLESWNNIITLTSVCSIKDQVWIPFFHSAFMTSTSSSDPTPLQDNYLRIGNPNSKPTTPEILFSQADIFFKLVPVPDMPTYIAWSRLIGETILPQFFEPGKFKGHDLKQQYALYFLEKITMVAYNIPNFMIDGDPKSSQFSHCLEVMFSCLVDIHSENSEYIKMCTVISNFVTVFFPARFSYMDQNPENSISASDVQDLVKRGWGGPMALTNFKLNMYLLLESALYQIIANHTSANSLFLNIILCSINAIPFYFREIRHCIESGNICAPQLAALFMHLLRIRMLFTFLLRKDIGNKLISSYIGLILLGKKDPEMYPMCISFFITILFDREMIDVEDATNFISSITKLCQTQNSNDFEKLPKLFAQATAHVVNSLAPAMFSKDRLTTNRSNRQNSNSYYFFFSMDGQSWFPDEARKFVTNIILAFQSPQVLEEISSVCLMYVKRDPILSSVLLPKMIKSLYLHDCKELINIASSIVIRASVSDRLALDWIRILLRYMKRVPDAVIAAMKYILSVKPFCFTLLPYILVSISTVDFTYENVSIVAGFFSSIPSILDDILTEINLLPNNPEWGDIQICKEPGLPRTICIEVMKKLDKDFPNSADPENGIFTMLLSEILDEKKTEISEDIFDLFTQHCEQNLTVSIVRFFMILSNYYQYEKTKALFSYILDYVQKRACTSSIDPTLISELAAMIMINAKDEDSEVVKNCAALLSFDFCDSAFDYVLNNYCKPSGIISVHNVETALVSQIAIYGICPDNQIIAASKFGSSSFELVKQTKNPVRVEQSEIDLEQGKYSTVLKYLDFGIFLEALSSLESASLKLEADPKSAQRACSETSRKLYQFGVIYARAGQKTIDEYLLNDMSAVSPQFMAFLKSIGYIISNQEGAALRNMASGMNSLYWQDRKSEVLYHVAPMLNTGFPEQKLTEMQADPVIILFAENNETLSFDMFASKWHQILIIVRPAKYNLMSVEMIRRDTGDQIATSIPLASKSLIRGQFVGEIIRWCCINSDVIKKKRGRSSCEDSDMDLMMPPSPSSQPQTKSQRKWNSLGDETILFPGY